MRGYTKHRKSTNGRMEVEGLRIDHSNGEIVIRARESRNKDRGVDIRVFLDADDAVKLVLLLGENNEIFRLAVKAELARLDYKQARDAAAE
ncbi:hypothetical protein FHS21_004180 [Phyllobacterium trifolii]|uniref:Uncharacterized protein n=1 Tax=Phyllobacterium trifolii TaxID=300193 RepID=A0A839UA54_9HYPH|nr:hypothetical protein [Phyllobacterium trifolii]MBB3147748.1 hypothetical protein [Phyllobacterium trifolii]